MDHRRTKTIVIKSNVKIKRVVLIFDEQIELQHFR